MKHVMLDLETLGTRAGCAVLSIGAVEFDPVEGLLGKQFYETCDWKAAGLAIDPETLSWWMEQDAAARAGVFSGKRPMHECGIIFKEWFESVGAELVWAHGATFDVPIWEAATYGISPPWKFWNVRDTRTLYDVSGVVPDRKQGTHHHALNDAVQQATAVIKGYHALGRGMGFTCPS